MGCPLYDMKVGFNHLVDVTHVNDPKSFFVRSTTVAELIDAIETPGLGPVPASELSLGQLVVYNSKTLKKFVRGDIRFINTDGKHVNYDIFAIDYGCFDKSVSRKRIYYPDSKANPKNQCPGLAVHCQLSLCEPRGETFSQEVIDSMKFFIGKHTATMTVISKTVDKLVVELRTVDCPRDIATTLGLIDLTTFTKGPYSVNRLTTSLSGLRVKTQAQLQFKHKQLKVGDVLHVRVQSGKELSGFYVADVNDFKKYISDQSVFAEYCKHRPMVKDEYIAALPCGVYLQNLCQYERGLIKKVDSNHKAVVQLVDWGTEVETDFTWIRIIDKEFFLAQPVIALYCSTTPDQLWRSPLPTFFFKGYEFGIEIKELGNNWETPHKVNMYPLRKLKIERGGSVKIEKPKKLE